MQRLQALIPSHHSIAAFFTEISTRMGPRWSQSDSLHLTAPGWQALGILHYDVNQRGLGLSEEERSEIFDVVAAIDWSRNSKEWVEAGLGQWAIRKGGDKEQPVILGAGRNNTQAIIDLLRNKTGLKPKLDRLEDAA